MRELLDFSSLSALLVLSACSNKNQEDSSEFLTTDTHMDIYAGDVVEIKDDNTILLQITEERGGYKVDVHYDEIEVFRYNAETDTDDMIDSNYKPVIGDELFCAVSTEFRKYV